MTAKDRAEGVRLRRCTLFWLACFWAMVLSILFPPVPRLVWNASASMPIGLYWVSPGALPTRGGAAVVRLSEPYRTLAARRHYLPRNVPLVKRVAGVPGDRVCAAGANISVNEVAAATRLRRDLSGRLLPWWQGCRLLGRREVFLLQPGVRGSFDGRYFGVTQASDLLGSAVLLWPR